MAIQTRIWNFVRMRLGAQRRLKLCSPLGPGPAPVRTESELTVSRESHTDHTHYALVFTQCPGTAHYEIVEMGSANPVDPAGPPQMLFDDPLPERTCAESVRVSIHKFALRDQQVFPHMPRYSMELDHPREGPHLRVVMREPSVAERTRADRFVASRHNAALRSNSLE